MPLSDSEKRDINKYIESDKPLPEKYRFLLFEEKREIELVWNGKTDEVTNVVLPFQTIEQVDEPRNEKETKLQRSLFDIDTRGRQLKGWTNKLIWGDNKLILSSLKNGPLRQEIEDQGGLKLAMQTCAYLTILLCFIDFSSSSTVVYTLSVRHSDSVKTPRHNPLSRSHPFGYSTSARISTPVRIHMRVVGSQLV